MANHEPTAVGWRVPNQIVRPDSALRYFVDPGLAGAGWHNAGSNLAAARWSEAPSWASNAAFRRRSPRADPDSTKYRLALAIIGLARQDVQIVRAAYLGMDWIGWFVLVPLSFASLLTGLVQSLGTEWGLFRHYWILAKLLINVLGNVGLLMFMLIFGSAVAAVPTSSRADVGELRSPSPLLHAGVALLVLLVVTFLSVYKPRGITPYGWRKQHERRTALQRKKQHQQRALSQPKHILTK